MAAEIGRSIADAVRVRKSLGRPGRNLAGLIEVMTGARPRVFQL